VEGEEGLTVRLICTHTHTHTSKTLKNSLKGLITRSLSGSIAGAHTNCKLAECSMGAREREKENEWEEGSRDKRREKWGEGENK